MNKNIGIIMDPISDINVEKDTTLALMLKAQTRGFNLFYLEMNDLFIQNGKIMAAMRPIEVNKSKTNWYKFKSAHKAEISSVSNLHCILMRKDPPFDINFLHMTYLLDKAKDEGVLVVNNPGSIRDCNEKLFATWFPDVCPPTIVTKNIKDLRNFLREHKSIVVKPLDGMGGASIFKVDQSDTNASVIFETLTHLESTFCMAQQYLKDIKNGDKRILIVNGKPIPYSLARVPSVGENRGNLAAGGSGIVQPLSDNDIKICEKVGPSLKARELYFVGIDVIGNFLTEINVTSPTCLVEIEKETGIDIANELINLIAEKTS